MKLTGLSLLQITEMILQLQVQIIAREYVPVLYYGKNKPSSNLGIRKTFSDVGKTVADFFSVENNFKGKSFLND